VKINFLFFLILLLASCSQSYTPKPKGFIKLDLPDKRYTKVITDCNFSFELPVYSILRRVNSTCFYNLNFPAQNAVLHITYYPLNGNLVDHIEKSRRLAYKHEIMADAIFESVYINNNDKVYGLLYNYNGVTATSTQFYLTDSTNHFFRAALYFNSEVTDSLLPINNFLKGDVKHIIETFRWEDY
tara:strand:- start:367 stop:921 length:555 start_codon:yes stop_codon:yes gene_type:complete